MSGADSLDIFMQRLDQRLEAMDKKLDALTRARTKSLEWIATLSQQIESLDDFREEVRATFEPFVQKLDNMDDIMRILRHATADVSRRVDDLAREGDLREAG